RSSAAKQEPLGPFEQEWSELDLHDGRFTDLHGLRYESTLSYTSDRYRDYLLSTSLYRLLDPVAAEAALDDTLAVVDAHGGTIDFVVHTDVALARRPTQ